MKKQVCIKQKCAIFIHHIIHYQVKNLKKDINLENTSDKIKFLNEIAKILAKADNLLQGKAVKTQITRKIENEENIIDEDLKNREDTIIALLIEANQKIFQKIKEKIKPQDFKDEPDIDDLKEVENLK